MRATGDQAAARTPERGPHPPSSARGANRPRKVSILTYHAVAEPVDRHTVSPESFAFQMKVIRDQYRVAPLRSLPLELSAAGPDSRLVILTFDDACDDFAKKAFPVLESLRIPSTVFVPTGCVGGHNRWDVKEGRPRRDILSWRQIRDLGGSSLVDFGSHTVDHVRMSALPAFEMRRQAVESKRALEDGLGRPVTMFAYPYGQPGDFSEETADCLRAAGYAMAVTTHWGTRNSVRDLLCLRRIALSSGDCERTIRWKIEGAYDWIGWGQRLRSVRRVVERRLPAGDSP